MKYWTHSITLIENCSKVSEGCLNCWSETIAYRFHLNQTDPFGNWTGNIVCREDRLPELLKGRKPKVIQIWNDAYHESVPISFIASMYDYMFSTPTCFKGNPSHELHTYLILTKRAERMKKVLTDEIYQYAVKNLSEDSPLLLQLAYNSGNWIYDNVWHGITTENQHTADERIPYLLQVPGKRWLSIEPLLEDIILPKECKGNIHGIVAGSETGRNARPAKLQWFRTLRDQCIDMKIPFFLKQIDAKRNRILDGRTHDELPWKYSIKP